MTCCTYVAGTLTVTPRTAVVSADSKEKRYGESDPAFTAAVSGLIGSDTLAYTLSRTDGENTGSYANELFAPEDMQKVIDTAGQIENALVLVT